MENLQKYIDKLNSLNFKDMYEGDFFLTWEKTDDELSAVFAVADALRNLRERNISTKIFDSGLGISLFRDNSTRTRFSFASACNLLGLEVQDLDEGKSQIAHGETVREDRQHDLLHGRRHRHPGRHVHRQGQRLYARGGGRRHRRPQGRRAGAEAHPGQPPVRHRPPHSVHGRHAPHHPPLRRRGEPEGQEGGHDLGLLSQLRQAPLRAPGRHRPDEPLRHGRGAGPPRGLRGHARGGGRGRRQRRQDRRHLHQDPLHGRGLQGRRHRVPQELGPLRRHGEAHRPVRQGRQRRASRPWRRSCWPRTPSTRTGAAPRS